MLLALSLGYWLAAGGYLANGAALGDDHSSHLAEGLVLARLLGRGHTDLWFADANLGYPLFLGYHPLPGLVLAGCLIALGWIVSPLAIFKLTVVGLWALLPWTGYRSARWLGADRWQALGAAALIPAVSTPSELAFGAGFNSLAVTGLYTQVYGLLLWPLAVSALYRLGVQGRGRVGVAAALTALTVLGHVFFGLLLAWAVGLLVLWSRGRAWRAVLPFGLGCLLTAWWVLPLLQHKDWLGGLAWRQTKDEGFPLGQLWTWLVRGELLDAGRLPFLCLLAVGGVALALGSRLRPELRHALRFQFLLAGLAALLFLGPANLGLLYRVLPLHRELPAVRYLSAAQLIATLLAGVTLGTLLRLAARGLDPRARLLLLAPGLVSAWIGVSTFARQLHTFPVDQPDYLALVERLRSGPPGRFAVPRQGQARDHMHMSLLSLLSGRSTLISFGRGYHDTRSLFFAEVIPLGPASSGLFDVRYAVSKAEITLPGFRPVWRQGPYVLYEAERDPGGKFALAHVVATISGPRRPLQRALAGLTPGLWSRSRSLVRVGGEEGGQEGGEGRAQVMVDAAGRVSQLPKLPERPPRGRILDWTRAPEHTPLRYSARVELEEPAWALLKVSAHPYWSATVDGQPAEVGVLGPNLMGVELTPGTHRVAFRYGNPWWQKLGAIASGLAIALLLVLPGVGVGWPLPRVG